tara:strand:+ start:214 stop:390 length:177 start_codon:yes stop_codon:yes gene_type:complete
MDLIPGVVLFLGAIATVGLIGWDTFKDIKPIKKEERQQSSRSREAKPKKQWKGLFNRG